MDRIISNPMHVAKLSNLYSKLGWCGFWAQVVIGSLPVILMAYLFMFAASPGPRAGFVLVEYLSIANLLTLVFTTLWAIRYTALARKMRLPDSQITYTKLVRTTWVGGSVGILGMGFAVIIMLVEVAHLLFYFLSTPQGGVPVIQTTQAESASWVSAVDMLSLMALLLTLVAELLFLTLSLYLLYRSLAAATDLTDPAVTSEPTDLVLADQSSIQ
jgi:hypothetical protein